MQAPGALKGAPLIAGPYRALTGLDSLGVGFPGRCPGLASVATLGLQKEASTARISRYESFEALGLG